MKKNPNKPAEAAKPEKEFEGFGEDELVNVPLSKKELGTLFNGVRALELIRRYEEADGEQKIIDVAVLLDLTAEPTWEVVSDLQGRFRDEEIKAAGGGEALEQFKKRIHSMTAKGGA
jgi:hypothetical protein